jgi:probable AcnD-accessory protein PrpF
MAVKKGIRQLVDEANARITTIPVEEARALLGDPDVQFVDIRDVRELEREGLVPGAFHAPRGMLEFWADPDSPYFKPVFGQDRRFVLYCQSGWRSALATAALQDMGLARVAHVAGGFHAWKAAGGEVARKETRAPAAATRLAGGQVRIPATYMRGGTSKGVFFRLEDLPEAARVPGPARDALLMRVIGSPDPYGKHTDGMGGATSSTSKCVILSKATVPGHDVDYLYGQVSIDSAFVDWSGNCGNLSAAVGPFAIANGLIDPARVPKDGTCTVRIWQANIGKTIVARVPVVDGQVRETGDFELDGVTFPAAEIVLEFVDPSDDGDGGAMFPTGNLVDTLDVPGIGPLQATLISAGIPTVFVNAADIGYDGTELQPAINDDRAALGMLEAIRVAGALRMGLIRTPEEAQTRQHTPKVAFVAPPKDYVASSGKAIAAADIDLNVRALSMGKLHHAMMGTASVAIATAAAVPGTLVNLAAGGGRRDVVRFGHPSGTLQVGASVEQDDGRWSVTKAVMSRSARVLMEGWVRVPADVVA